MKFFVTILFLYLPLAQALTAQELELAEVREKFFILTKDHSGSPTFYQTLLRIEACGPIYMAYKGATEAILAKHYWNPWKRYKFLKKSERTLEKAVNEEMENIEIRFIRFSIENNIPRFLGMSDHLKEDRHFILENVDDFDTSQLSSEVLDYILLFLEEQGGYDQSELGQIKTVLTSTQGRR